MSKKVGEIVRKIRKEKGISLRELAKQVDVSFVNISYIENDIASQRRYANGRKYIF